MTESNKHQLYQRLAWAYFILAALSMFLSISWPVHNEEYVYTSTLLDMAMHHHWLQPELHGSIYLRPPMMNWLSWPFLKLFGLSNAIIATRLLTALSTVATAFWVVWFVKKLQTRDMSLLPVLSGAVFLTGDVLFVRGWLAYADPLFTLFVFGSMALLYLAMTRHNYFYLSCSLLFVFMAYLTKEPTAYVFYVTLGLCLLMAGVGRDFVKQYKTWAVGIIGIVAPYILWLLLLNYSSSQGFVGDFFSHVAAPAWNSDFFHRKLGLITRLVTAYNLIFLISLVALYCSRKAEKIIPVKHLRAIALIILLTAAPYFILGGNSQPRYLMPIIPWIAIYVSQAVLRCNARVIVCFFIACWFLLALKYVTFLNGRMIYHGKLISMPGISLKPIAKLAANLSQGNLCVYGALDNIEPKDALGEFDMQLAPYGNLMVSYSPDKTCKYLLSQSPDKSIAKWGLVSKFSTTTYLRGRPYITLYLYKLKG